MGSKNKNENKRDQHVTISPEIHRRLRIHSAITRRSIKKIVHELVEKNIPKYESENYKP